MVYINSVRVDRGTVLWRILCAESKQIETQSKEGVNEHHETLGEKH